MSDAPRPATLWEMDGDHIALVSSRRSWRCHELRDQGAELAKRLTSRDWHRPAVVAQPADVVLTALLAGQLASADVVLLRNRWPNTDELLASYSADSELHGDMSVSPRPVATASPPPPTHGRIVLTTSGTTGSPKAVVHTLERLLGRIKAPPAGAPAARWLLTYDPASFAGLQVLLTAWISRSALCVPDEFDVASIAEMAHAQRPTHVSGTPTFWRALLVALGDSAAKLPLERLTLGGEIADQATLTRLREVYPQAAISHIYASTEAGSVFTVKDGRAGFPRAWLESGVEGVRLRINSRGVLEVNSPRRMEGFAHQGAVSDDWIMTGDLVSLSDDRVMFVGREDCVINVGGGKVWPESVENVLCSVPGIAEAFVYGKRNPLLGALVMADVVVSNDLDAATVIEAARTICGQRLQRHEVPQRITAVPRIATNASGKKVRSG